MKTFALILTLVTLRTDYDANNKAEYNLEEQRIMTLQSGLSEKDCLAATAKAGSGKITEGRGFKAYYVIYCQGE